MHRFPGRKARLGRPPMGTRQAVLQGGRTGCLTRSLIGALLALGCSGLWSPGVWAQTPPAPQPPTPDAARPAALIGVVGVNVMRQSFHTYCPFAVDQPSVTLATTDADWAALLKKATTVPPPYSAGDVSFTTQRVMVVASAATPSPTMTMQVLKAPLAVAFNESAQRLSVRVREIDTPLGPGMLGAAVVSQPCLVLWLQLNKPVREVIARTTNDKLLGRQLLR